MRVKISADPSFGVWSEFVATSEARKGLGGGGLLQNAARITVHKNKQTNKKHTHTTVP